METAIILVFVVGAIVYALEKLGQFIQWVLDIIGRLVNNKKDSNSSSPYISYDSKPVYPNVGVDVGKVASALEIKRRQDWINYYEKEYVDLFSKRTILRILVFCGYVCICIAMILIGWAFAAQMELIFLFFGLIGFIFVAILLYIHYIPCHKIDQRLEYILKTTRNQKAELEKLKGTLHQSETLEKEKSPLRSIDYNQASSYQYSSKTDNPIWDLDPFDQSDDITSYRTTKDIVRSGRFTAEERQREYRRRGKSPAGVVDGIYSDMNLEPDSAYSDADRDWDADA